MARREDVSYFSSDSQRKSRTPPDPRRVIAGLARQQHGLVTFDQLQSVRLGGGAIDYRVEVGSLHRVHRGVYAVGHMSLSAHARSLAAVLALGPDAVLSHG